MILNIADNVISPLGFTSQENWAAVLRGDSALSLHTGDFNLPEPFFGATIDNVQIDNHFQNLASIHKVNPDDFTKFEKIAILSVSEALSHTNIDAANPDTMFVLSTTKGNVELLGDNKGFPYERLYLWKSAQIIASFFKNPNEPMVASNACISGCAAQMAAERLLRKKRCRYVVVVGADVLSKFVISGFQSFKSLSTEMCKPFDADRCGLNLGEAAATIIYCADDEPAAGNADIGLAASAVCNDANHISAPSRTGEGQLAALQEIADISPADFANAAFVSSHGTATRYNDDMESVALNRAGIAHLPVNSLKGYFGHTLGAAGILETIISKYEIIEKTVIKTLGTDNPGTVSPLNVILKNTQLSNNHSFIKIISGFGGINAALLFCNLKGGKL